MELNIITVAIITGFIIIYVVSLITYLILLGLEWRNDNLETNFQEKGKKRFLVGLAGCIPIVNTFILLYYFFNKSSE